MPVNNSLFSDMAPYYELVCADLGWSVDQALLEKMKDANLAKLKELDNAVEDAEQNLGETEVRDFMLKKAEYLSKIGDKVSWHFGLKCRRTSNTTNNNNNSDNLTVQYI